MCTNVEINLPHTGNVPSKVKLQLETLYCDKKDSVSKSEIEFYDKSQTSQKDTAAAISMKKLELFFEKGDSKNDGASEIKSRCPSDDKTLSTASDFSTDVIHTSNSNRNIDKSNENDLNGMMKKLEHSEMKCKLLKNDNKKLQVELTHEKYKANKLAKKVQFIKDNQDVFVKLKEAYLSLKYNANVNGKLAEVRESGTQTLEERALCKFCYETEKIRQEVEFQQDFYKNSVFLSTEKYDMLQATLATLKSAILCREETWAFNCDRDFELRNYIASLENENKKLRELLVTRANTSRYNDSGKTSSDTNIGIFKKIIVKYEKRLREKNESAFDKCDKCPPFNQKEKNVINELMAKYYSRLKTKLHYCQSRSSESKSNEDGFASHSSTHVVTN